MNSSWIQDVRHAGIVVRDMELALKFYRDILGLTIHRAMDEKGDFLNHIFTTKGLRVTTVKMGTAQGAPLLELLKFDHPPIRDGVDVDLFTRGPTHVAFTVNDLDGLHEKPTAAGAKFNNAPAFSPDGFAKVAFCQDFEGNYLELVEQRMAAPPKE